MIKIKTLRSVEELQKTIGIQKNSWGFSDLDVESHHIMTRIQKYGGLIQGLYLNNLFIGFTFALIGKWEEKYFIYSHMTAIKKEYQGKGYGFLLKKAQRKEVLKMGYEVIRWNFDPLESLNAFFNFHRLGVISTEYERNIYGKGESGLHQGLPTDRLIATWHLNSDPVIRKMKTKEPRNIEDIPGKTLGQFREEAAYIEIPQDIRTLKQENLKQAAKWRQKTGELFDRAFARKWIARDIVFSPDCRRVFCKLYREKKS